MKITYNTIIMEQIVLGLGSNVGDRLRYLRNAVRAIMNFTGALRVSHVYMTKPQDYLQQDDFLNMVLAADYDKSPDTLLAAIQKIEKDNGRNRAHAVNKGPRTLDIDILLFGMRRIQTESLIVPHPAMTKRQFVLIPLLELLPDFADPITKTPYKKFLSELENQGVEKYCALF